MDEVRAKATRARAAALALQRAPDDARRRGVLAMADALEAAAPRIAQANAADLADARDLPAPLVARLKLPPEKLRLTLAGVRSLARLPDPLGRTLRSTLLDEGLRLYQVTVPLGVVACVFESRPDAAIQIPSLTLRSGNAALLKGGREAERTNRAIAEALRDGLATAGLPPDAVQLLEGRAEVDALLGLDDLVDLVVPRGSTALVRHVMARTRIPVLGHAEGVCHVYVDAAADVEKALRVCVDAKVDNPAACNAAEAFLVHRAVAPRVAPLLRAQLEARGVEVSESPADYGKEFGDLKCVLALVDSLEEAVAFVNRHGSRHTDAIVTEDKDAARRFVEGVDAAGVMVNASPRFADGYRYGLGAEVGVSTSKVHARGPVGLEGLTTTKWVLLGDGHAAGPYQGDAPRPFKHAPLDARLADEW